MTKTYTIPRFIEDPNEPDSWRAIEATSDDSLSAHIAELRLEAAEKIAESDGLQAYLQSRKRRRA
jgi:hypothetical protein